MTDRQAPLKLTPGQLGTMASSVRLTILQRLEFDGEATARELAQRLGRPVTALYHHLSQLEKAGLLHIVDRRKAARRPEAVYALVSTRLSSAEAVKTPRGKKALIQLAARVVAASLRAFGAAATHAAARFEGKDRNTAVRHLVFRADRKSLARINALIGELEDAASSTTVHGEDMLLTVVLAAMPSRGND